MHRVPGFGLQEPISVLELESSEVECVDHADGIGLDGEGERELPAVGRDLHLLYGDARLVGLGRSVVASVKIVITSDL